jgi:hypothetical protein
MYLSATARAQTEIIVWHLPRRRKLAFEKVVNQYSASQNKIKVAARRSL